MTNIPRLSMNQIKSINIQENLKHNLNSIGIFKIKYNLKRQN